MKHIVVMHIFRRVIMSENKINANPTKEFFITMLTRDIDLKAAIVELIDNSIDGAKRTRNGDYKGLWIKLIFNSEQFTIEDNCGGISIDIAQHYAFRFGRDPSRPKESGSYTGVFGIGMKRSLFRLGAYFEVISHCEKEGFELDVDVEKWTQEGGTDWSFQFRKIWENTLTDIEKCGTRIIVKKLNKGIAENLNLEYFHNQLIHYIEKYRTTAIEDGLDIYVNEKKIVFVKEQLVDSDNIAPFSKELVIEDVKAWVLAGIAPKGHPENAGWYVYCNGRLVLHADQTTLTGWGVDGIKRHHPSLAAFRGFVFFESDDSEKLPWNTTKTSVDESSMYYIAAKVLMKEATQQILKFLSKISSINDEAEREKVEKTIYDSSLVVLNTANMKRLRTKENIFNFKMPIPRKEHEKMSIVTYKKPSSELEKVKKKLKVTSYREVGEKTYEYYLSRECDFD